jgi:O-antigen ligase
MMSTEANKSISKLLILGPFLISVFLLSKTNTDPVNVTKLFMLGGVGVGALFFFLARGLQYTKQNFRLPLIVVLMFDLLLIISLFTSKAPLTQNFFGAYGRNNGVLTYLLFSFILLASLLITEIDSFKKILFAFLATGILNIFYCAWVLAFGDFIGWNNPYKSILGLLGNPDFISALLGMYFVGSLALIFSSQFPIKHRVFLALTSIAALFEILKSHAIQGLVVSAGGVGLIVFFKLRSKFKNDWLPIFYLLLSFVLGIFAILGTLQKGPLGFLYKRSVSLRGSYWHAGLSMGWNNPIFGVGMDTYGDWYRRTRPPAALIDTPGVNTVSNVSHNVVIDFFASGGFPLLLSYLGILILGLIAIVRFTLRNRDYDPIFVSLATIWICYEVQSFISINQIGLAIWGWLFTGLLIAYEKISQVKNLSDRNPTIGAAAKRIKEVKSPLSSNLIIGIGMLVGLMLAAPPFLADSKWFSALNSRNVVNVERALAPSLVNPSDSSRYFQAVNVFQTSNLPVLARKYALKAVKFNPDFYDAWKILYKLPNVNQREKSEALKNMKRLDPKNPDVTAP